MRDHSWKDYWASPYVPYRNWWKLWQVKWDITHAWWKVYFRSQVYVQCWKLWCESVILNLWNIPVAIWLDLHFDFCIFQWFQQLYQAWILRELMKKKTAANISTKANDWLFIICPCFIYQCIHCGKFLKQLLHRAQFRQTDKNFTQYKLEVVLSMQLFMP